MKRLLTLIFLLAFPAMNSAQSPEPGDSFVVSIEHSELTDNGDPRVPLRISLESGKEILAAELTIVYDPKSLAVLEVSPGGPAESFTIFEAETAVPGKIEILLTDFTGQTIPAGKVENLITISFAVLPGAAKGEHPVIIAKAILADQDAGRHFPAVVNGGILNPFAVVTDNFYQYYGSDYAFWVNAENDSPISFYLTNRKPVIALELRVRYNQEVCSFLGLYGELRILLMKIQEVHAAEGFVSIVITDFDGGIIPAGSGKLFTLAFTNTKDPLASFSIEQLIIADTNANRTTPEIFYQKSYTPFETITADTTENRPRIVLSTTEVSFGEVPVSLTSDKKIIIMNLGDVDLVVSKISSSEGAFSPDTDSATIGPSSSRDLPITFSPQNLRSYTATLTITSNDGILKVSLTGTGVEKLFPEISVEPAVVEFGEVVVLSPSKKTLVITNSGTGPLEISDIVVPGFSPFSVSPDSLTIAAGENQAVTVTFTPWVEQSYSENILIISNNTPLTVTATGTGVSGPGCDFDGNGTVNVSDVIALLIFQRDRPGDRGSDFNRDGKSNILDAIAMLLAQRDNSCPDAGALLSAAGASRYAAEPPTLSQGDIRYLEEIAAGLDLTPGERAAFNSVLYGSNAKARLPGTFRLEQNSPNPFNPATVIVYHVPEAPPARLTLKVFDLQGRLVRTLVNEVREPGTYSVFWNATDEAGRKVASGVYLYRLQAGGRAQTRKMVLLK